MAILGAVREAYRTASSYEATGKAITRVIQPAEGTETSIGATFTIKLGRPSLYRITWTQQLDFEEKLEGAVWNDGEGPRLYLSQAGTTAELPSDEVALSAATGASLGAAHLVPSLFYSWVSSGNLLDRLDNVRVEGRETVNDEPCHIVAGEIEGGIGYRLWISTNAPVVVQLENTLGGSASTHGVPESTPEQEERALKALSMEDTPENRQLIRARLEKARALMSTVRGTMRQLHHGARFDRPLPVEAYSFQAPD